MSIKESFNIEKYGMFRTILEYSTCNFINSYCEQLLKMTYPNDKEYLKYQCKEYCHGMMKEILKK